MGNCPGHVDALQVGVGDIVAVGEGALQPELLMEQCQLQVEVLDILKHTLVAGVVHEHKAELGQGAGQKGPQVMGAGASKAGAVGHKYLELMSVVAELGLEMQAELQWLLLTGVALEVGAGCADGTLEAEVAEHLWAGVGLIYEMTAD